MRRRLWSTLILGAFLATFGAAARAEGPAGPRLAIVTFERRAADVFKGRPAAYGEFLLARRKEVRSLLFGPQGRLAKGDVVVLLTDGAPAAFTRTLRLAPDASEAEVMEALDTLLQVPGESSIKPGVPPRLLWSGRWEGDGFPQEVDAALRRHVTCPLAGLPAYCTDESRPRSPGTASFSRPLLSLPRQLDLGLREIEKEGWPAPLEVLWIWVQAGERFNDLNSLAAELDRDFPPDTAQALKRYRHTVLGDLDVDYLADAEVPEPPEGGGVTCWRLSAVHLDGFTASRQIPSLRLEQRSGEGWREIRPTRTPVTKVLQPAAPLLETPALRVGLRPEARAASRLTALTGTARCFRDGPAAIAEEALTFAVEAPQSARLTPDSERRLDALAKGCLPAQGLFYRLGRELGQGEDQARLQIEAQATLDVPPGQLFRTPPIAVAASQDWSWRYEPLRTAEHILLFIVLLLLLATLAGAVQLFTYMKAPTELDLVLIGEAGEALSAERPLAFQPGGGPVDRPGFRAALVRRSGRSRHGRFTLRLEARGFPAEIPLVAGRSSRDVIVLRRKPGTQPVRTNAPVTFQQSGSPGRAAHGLQGEPLELFVPEEVLDVDRMPVDTPQLAGLEIAATVEPQHTGFRSFQRTFYFPCTVTIHRATALPPALQLVPRQGFLYRGLRPLLGGGSVSLGVLRIRHRADATGSARPWPVRLQLRLSAVLLREAMEPLRLTVGFEGAGQRSPALEQVLDGPQADLPVWVEPLDRSAAGGTSGQVRIEVTGVWSEIHGDIEGPALPLSPSHQEIPWYPTMALHGVAVDFGTSATRLAFLAENQLPQQAMCIAVPADLILDLEAGKESGELISEVALDKRGTVAAAGAEAFTFSLQKSLELLPSLKERLIDQPDSRMWRAAEQVIALLAERIEGPRRDPARALRLARVRRDRWLFQELVLPRGLRYLLLVTIPDTFGAAEQKRFLGCFSAWKGLLDILPLREAEAVVYGALIEGSGGRPESTLVVDVGAGTVDYAAVRSVFDQVGELQEIRIEGLSVSRAAGSAYGRALRAYVEKVKVLGTLTPASDDRTLREFKEKNLTASEVGGPISGEWQEFLASSELRQHLQEAIVQPLAALSGRLCLQEGWSSPSFDQVILTGRGSLAAGWKATLVEQLGGLGWVKGEERQWLRWLSDGTPAERSDRLKGAVVRGALALIGAHQARIQRSTDILRDHLVFLLQQGPTRFSAQLLAPAGHPLTNGGFASAVPVGDWMAARLVLASHPPQGAPGVPDGRSVSAAALWIRSSGGGAAEDNGSSLQIAASQDIGTVPRGARALEVRARSSGEMEWRFLET